MEKIPANHKEEKVIIRKCHHCGQVTESHTEVNKCVKCQKSFLPLNYFEKVHASSQKDYQNLFAESHEIEDNDLIKGIFVLW